MKKIITASMLLVISLMAEDIKKVYIEDTKVIGADAKKFEELSKSLKQLLIERTKKDSCSKIVKNKEESEYQVWVEIKYLRVGKKDCKAYGYFASGNKWFCNPEDVVLDVETSIRIAKNSFPNGPSYNHRNVKFDSLNNVNTQVLELMEDDFESFHMCYATAKNRGFVHK
ncbi:MAG: hypothetical protein Q7S59_01670 [Sulfurimonas sp.]|nr:hypothetical protein [Sulfurimonas sp.]